MERATGATFIGDRPPDECHASFEYFITASAECLVPCLVYVLGRVSVHPWQIWSLAHNAGHMLGDQPDVYEAWHPSRRSPLRWLPLTAVGLLGILAGYGLSAYKTPSGLSTARPVLLQETPGMLAPASRYALESNTPTDFQMSRGDCWLFATIGLLEDSYRRQGMRQGYLKPNEYVRMSRQAFGASVLQACRKAPHKCMFDGDAIYTGNSTTGGEVEMMYKLQYELNDAALPYSVCPYIPTTGPISGEVATTDMVCDGLAAAREINPLQFRINSLTTYYDRESIKTMLRSHGQVLAFVTNMIVLPYWLPCTDASKNAYVPGGGAAFEPTGQTCDNPSPCPLERPYVGVDGCISTNRPMYTMKGEWGHRASEPQLIKEGGHAIGLVGFSDTYRTEEGHTGGYIVRNSWEDGLGKSHGAPARGSHTVDYFMQKISDYQERDICPNVHSPRSWYPCPTLAECQSKQFSWFARSVKLVLKLQCHTADGAVAHDLCDEGERLFLKNLTAWGSGLTTACFLRDRATSARGGEFCTPPLWLDDLATLVSPTPEEAKPNDPDRCGYYFVPYATFEAINAAMGNCWVSHLDIQWSETSYAINAAQAAPGKDYTLLKKNTKTLAPPIWNKAPQPEFAF